MSKFDKTYTNGEVTVFWKPDMCIHSAKCFHSLPQVFNPKIRPWVQLDNSTTEKIVETVKNCPSGALSFKYNDETRFEEQPLENNYVKIQVTKNGPLIVNGSCVITDSEGNETIKEGKFSLCRCGLSNKKPFCDGTHRTLTHDL